MRSADEDRFIVENLKHPRYNPIPKEEIAEEARLFNLYRAGDQKARRRLLDANLRFVAHVARAYRNHGLSFGEMVSEGTIGLERALQRHEPSRGIRFISYAVWWIRAKILLALAEQVGPVKRPPAILQKAAQIDKAFTKLAQDMDRLPTLEELAAALGVSIGKLAALQSLIRGPIALETLVTDDGDTTLQDRLRDPDADTAREAAAGMDGRFLDKLLESCTPEEREVLRRFAGIGFHPETLDAIGGRVGLTRERIRQIKFRTCAKARLHGNTLKIQAILHRHR